MNKVLILIFASFFLLGFIAISYATTTSRPTYVTFRLKYHIGTNRTNDNFTISNSTTFQIINAISDEKTGTNIGNAFVCSYDKTEYTNGLVISLIHSYQNSYLSKANFTATGSSDTDNYTLEIKNDVDNSKLLIALTKGECSDINDNMHIIRKQAIPSSPFSSFSENVTTKYPYEIRAMYEKININGSEHYVTGTNKLCIEKTGTDSASKPIVYIRRC